MSDEPPAPKAIRYTPFLDEMGFTLKDEIPTHAANIIDAALAYVSSHIDWGSYQGRRRKPCHEQPLLLAGMPLGQYHCPMCSEMQMAGYGHLEPDRDYERMTGHPWPAGYEGVGEEDGE